MCFLTRPMRSQAKVVIALLLAGPAAYATLNTQGQQMQGQQMQGQQMQGQQMQGQQMQGQQMQGAGLGTGGPVAADPPINHRYDGWSLNWERTGRAQITRGELTVQWRGARRGGTSLVG